MKNFELFLGCHGNGVSVCNKLIEEHGDYKKIAHISSQGIIKWYVAPNTIPNDVLTTIERVATVEKIEYNNR